MSITLGEAHAVIRLYSTTWYEPVASMPKGLNEATACAYLMMRAIDEIEDHPRLRSPAKAGLLRRASIILQTRFTNADFVTLFSEDQEYLPEVTVRLGEWAMLAPPEIGPRITDTFAAMADRMANWVESNWRIRTERDLDRYTYAVAGTLGLLLSDLWAWHDGTRTNRTLAVAYGRALQAANILIDRHDDQYRGVDFWPDGWTLGDVLRYARTEMAQAAAYVDALPPGPAHDFCVGPLARYQGVLFD